MTRKALALICAVIALTGCRDGRSSAVDECKAKGGVLVKVMGTAWPTYACVKEIP